MKKLTGPANIQWELTPVCNHDCIHCYNYWRNDEIPLKHPDIDYMAIAKAIALINPVHVVLTGGEPLLVFEKMIDAAEYLHSKGIYLSWNTNATLVTSTIAKQMNHLNASAFVSLPCGDSETCDRIVNVPGTLDKITAGIEKMLSASVPVAVNVVVSSYNQHKLYETAAFAKKIGVEQFCIAPASRPFGADKAFDNMAPSPNIISILCKEAIHIEKELGLKVSLTGALPGCAYETDDAFQRFAYTKSCTAGRVSCALDSLGNVKACARDEKFYGNVLDESFESIWENMAEWRDGSLVPIECKECRDLRICRGGCRLEACSVTGKRDVMDTFAKRELLPLPFKKEPTAYHWMPDQMFKIRSGLRWKHEEFGWRVSLGPRFTYMTDITKEWIDTHSFFTLEDMVDKFGKDAEGTLKITITILNNAGIIEEVRNANICAIIDKHIAR